MTVNVLRITMLLLVGILGAPMTTAALQVVTGNLVADVHLDPWHLVFRDGNGAVILEEHDGTGSGPSGRLGFRTSQGWFHATRTVSSGQLGDRTVVIADTNDPEGHQLEIAVGPDGEGVIRVEMTVLLGGCPTPLTAVGIGWQAQPGERFFGFGERATALDQRGNTIENYVSDGPYWPEERPVVALFVPAPGFRERDDATYFPVPWLLSSRGYGVLIDNADPSYFRLGTDQPDAWSLEAVGAPEGMTPRPAPPALRFRVFAGPRPRDVLRRFTQRVGRQPSPTAAWIFGPWFQPGGSLESQLAQVQKLQDAGAPLSVVQTYTHYLPCGSQVGRRDAERQRNTAMHARGLAVTTYFNPMICESYAPRFGEAAAADALMRTAGGQPYIYNYTGSTIFRVGQFDFSIPAGRSAYQQLLAEAVEDGHDGWMEDFGEYTPLDAFTRSGETGGATHNRYVVDYHCAGFDFTQRQTRPIVRFQRSGWTGVAPCAQVVWGGDPSTDWGFDGLASALRSGLSLGLSGISTWGSDIGGYFAFNGRMLTSEMLMRWVQLGAVSGVMRTERNGFALPDYRRPQVEDDEQLPNWRRYARLRTRLYPYITGAAAEYQHTGLPLMRHLALEVPDDPQATARDDEFVFGPALLAAPVLTPDTREREVYLPAGGWIDLWRAVAYDEPSGELRLGEAAVIHGGASVRVPAPLEELPLLIRAGALLPLLPADVDTLSDYPPADPNIVPLAARDDEIHLLAFPRRRARARFFGRDVVRSTEYSGAWVLSLRGTRPRHYVLQASLATLAQPFTPCTVEWAGQSLAGEAWSYDAAHHVLHVDFTGQSGRLVVRRRCG